jgi:putative membrane protein
MLSLLIRWLVNTLALFLVTYLVHGIHGDSLTALAVAALVLGLLNAVVKPVLFFLTLPLTIVTLGLFLLVLNGLMLELTGWLVRGFHIDSFPSAILGALILAVLSLLTSRIGREPARS